MDFNIKKNATLPVLKMKVIQDGRNDYNWFVNTTDYTGLFFSMVNVESGIPKITSRPAKYYTVTGTTNGENEYYVYYQFQHNDTNKVGRYEAQFMLRNEDGVLILPIREKLNIIIEDSLLDDDLDYSECFIGKYECCIIGPSSFITPTPTVTPTIW